ncbi:MAG: DegV family protein [Anaerolineae bacterium]|nr:DegV family protein [Anaerolineae bacterium]
MTDQPVSTASSPVIVTDAGCDLPLDVFEGYGIRVAPLKILFGGETYLSGVDITPEEFYARLGKGDVHPTTSQPTMVEFMELYRKLGAEGRPILSVHLSSGLSGTYNVAYQAARELPDLDITVVDTGTLTGALGVQVLTAARAAEAGHSPAQILPLIKQDHANGNMFFSEEDLSYLHKGGRIGTVRYQIGQVLNIKPVVTVAKTGDKAGTYVSAGRARSLVKAGEVFIKNMIEHIGEGATIRAVTVFGDDPEVVNGFNVRLREAFDVVYLGTVPTAPVLGVHVGPGALGIGYASGDWPV